ncbi:phosphotransferase enzyme family protein [Jeotgalibacillus proteolyticus]|uniref:Aminoglycoside phosphotransferase domain-containing protein n=1 Tax=Jeotgalibacillus proteolyticus TaxID=2082395 RepID=A0A2S5GDB7_9BACL|nr:phosphotransferase [Jeotgalibacillus proteolyticus]PPA70915.1 hypothetical protein C4B60_09005 [Jeotgalibacillus proteolyticus]
MEKWIDDQFNEQVLKEAANRFGAVSTNAKKLGDFENYVFEVHKDSLSYILRLTHSSHRCRQDVLAELEWINFLHENGVNASLVHQSANGELVEELKLSDSSFFVCLFDKAPGDPVKAGDDHFSAPLFEKWGEMIGKMHRVTKNFEPGEARREHWTADDVIDLSNFLDSQKDGMIITGNEMLVNKIKEIPETKERFGLIHSDIHSGNFFFHEGDVHVFDFDDSTYFYYLSDIAIPLYYAVWAKLRNANLEERSAFGSKFYHSFLKGYVRENHLLEEWVEQLPLFLKLRDYALYGVFHKKVDLENGNERERELVREIRGRLLQNELIVDLNYKEIFQAVQAGD